MNQDHGSLSSASESEVRRTPETPVGADRPSQQSRKPHRWRRWIVLTALLLLAVACHRPLLTAVGRHFVCEDAVEQGAILLVLGGDGRFEITSDLYRAGTVTGVWLVERRPNYLVREGIVPAEHVMVRDQLRAGGLPDDAIVLLEGVSVSADDTARIVGNELADRPAVRVVTLCDRFNCRYSRRVFDSILAPAHSAQVALRGLPDADFDETNWWRSRRGVKALLERCHSPCPPQADGTLGARSAGLDPRRLRERTAGGFGRYHMSRRVKLLLGCGLLGLGLCLISAVGGTSLLTGAANWLDVGQPPACVDHVLVLPGGENIRPAVAAALVNVGLARDVLVPQTRVSQDERDGIVQTNADIIKSVLRHRGVPEARIVTLEGASGSTYDDVQALRRFLADGDPGRVAVVTSGYHTRRARLTLEQVLGPEAQEVLVISAPDPDCRPESWWQSREGFRLVIEENVKLILYLVRYSAWTPGLLALAVLGLAIVGWRRGRRNHPTEAAASFLIFNVV